MNTFASKLPSSTNAKVHCLKASTIFLSLFLLTACQETPETDIPDETATSTQTTPVTTNINVNEAANDKSVDDDAKPVQTDADPARDMSVTELEKDLGGTVTAPSNTAATPNPEQAIKGAQITDVRYKSAAGDTLSVVFETSAAGLLNAIVTRPNQSKITLSAPEGQGNNPTYRSADGSIQLVSHAGGGTIDLIQNNKVTSFDAVSAEAEVITE
jgi:hypothetical protein